jgi:hypothetical protein
MWMCIHAGVCLTLSWSFYPVLSHPSTFLRLRSLAKQTRSGDLSCLQHFGHFLLIPFLIFKALGCQAVCLSSSSQLASGSSRNDNECKSKGSADQYRILMKDEGMMMWGTRLSLSHGAYYPFLPYPHISGQQLHKKTT